MLYKSLELRSLRMKKRLLVLGMLVLLLASAIGVVGCDDGSKDNGGGDTFPKPKGKLTVIDIPSEYNGKFAYVPRGEIRKNDSSFYTIYVYGAAKLERTEYGGVKYTPVAISGGKVEIPLYTEEQDTVAPFKLRFIAYDGNGFLSYDPYLFLEVSIVENGSGDYLNLLTENRFSSGAFDNGNLTVQWVQSEW
jgi:hypothetical protein